MLIEGAIGEAGRLLGRSWFGRQALAQATPVCAYLGTLIY